MHIALVSPGWPLGVPNGIVTYVHQLRLGLLALGHRVTVLTFKIEPGCQTQGVRLIRRGWRIRLDATVAHILRRHLDPHDWPPEAIADTLLQVHNRDPIDVVEMEESFGWCAEVQRRVPFPVVVKLHGPAFLTQIEAAAPSTELQDRIEREGVGLRQARVVYAPAADTINRAFVRYGIHHLPRTVIRNPIAVRNDDDHLWRQSECDPKLLLFVGRFDRIKGGDFVLKAFRRMLDLDPSLRLMFVGPCGGRIDDGGRSMSIDDAIDAWFGPAYRSAVDVRGPLPPLAVQELRRQAAATLVCSRWENQPNTALEAMAQGCPVVAVSAGGVGEVIEDGHTGVLTAVGSEEKFATAALRTIRSLETAAALGLAARTYVRDTHEASAIAARTVELYNHALES